MNKNPFTYKKSGVDIDAADKFVKFISSISTKKRGKKKFSNIGGFGAISNIPNNIKTIDLEVYNMQSQIIVSKTYTVNAGKVQLNLEDKPNGIYFVKVNSEQPVFVKVIKK